MSERRAAVERAEQRGRLAVDALRSDPRRLAGDGKVGQERLDVPPAQFARQLRLLRLLRFRPVPPGELAAFHAGERTDLPPRSYVVTVDDGFRDCVEPLLRHADVRPQLFVPTHEVGGRSWWAGDEPLASWEDLERLPP